VSLKKCDPHSGQVHLAGRTRPTHSLNPILRYPSPSQHPRNVSPSPSAKNVRLSPLGSWIGALPPPAGSGREPAWSWLRTGQRARSQKIPGLQVALAAGAVCYELRSRPERRLIHCAAGEPSCSEAGVVHGRSLQPRV
jgi:hypothetical protein